MTKEREILNIKYFLMKSEYIYNEKQQREIIVRKKKHLKNTKKRKTKKHEGKLTKEKKARKIWKVIDEEEM